MTLLLLTAFTTDEVVAPRQDSPPLLTVTAPTLHILAIFSSSMSALHDFRCAYLAAIEESNESG